jgi:hypothetical protein
MARPSPPYPSLVRAPSRAFGWLDARLLREEWLARLGPDATAVLTLLALAADRSGSSYYGRDRMGHALGLTRSRIDAGLARLLELCLVAVRPWRDGHPDGVWQLLPLPPPPVRSRSAPVPIADVLAQLRRRPGP